MSEDAVTQPSCTLSETEYRHRRESVRSTLGAVYAGVTERPDGYTLHFDGRPIEAVANFVGREFECCSFADYEITVPATEERVHLGITGPEGTKELFGDELVGFLESDARNDERNAVRALYGEIASDETESSSCCAGAPADEQALRLGYDEHDLERVPDAANMGLGCGNPTAIASLDRGDVVLDLGAGGGFDCFLAAQAVGPEGRVIGVDMTPEMIEKAREHNDAEHVEFRLGEIEHVPVGDGTVDVIISNCVINLSPAKAQVFAEAYRVLRPGGRLAISDVVATAELPEDAPGWENCAGGAASIQELESTLADLGFEDIAIEPDDDSETFIRDWDPDRDLSEYIQAASIEARKPE